MPGEKALRKNETLYTPWLYACHSADGLNGMSQQYHRFCVMKLSVSLSKTPPCTSQCTGGIYFNHNPDYIMQMAERAAALGVERFIIDDGWFKDVTMTARLWATGIPMNRNTRTG